MADFLPAARGPAVSARGSDAGRAAEHSITISVEAFHTICRLRRGREPDAKVIERALAWLDSYTIVARALGSEHLRKAGVVVRQMRGAGYNDELTTAVCRAIFGGQQEKDLRKAFKIFDRNRSGCIDRDEFRQALPLMGESVNKEQVEELFKLVDADDTGQLDFEEFSALVRGMNTSADAGEIDVFKPFRYTADGLEAVGETVGETLGIVANSTGSAASAISSAWAANLSGLGPFEMRRAGTVINRMREAGYTDKAGIAICRALFCGQTERHLRKAFSFFDTDQSGFIDGAELRRALPLMGEDIPPDKIDALYTAADKDRSGLLEFGEFCDLVKAMNPQEEPSLDSPGAGRVRSTLVAVADTWDSISGRFV